MVAHSNSRISVEIISIFVLSLIAIISYYIIFLPFGGPVSFVVQGHIVSRLELFSGKGYLLILYSFFALSNAIFFAFLILRRNTISNKIRYILYAAFTLHTLLLWISSVPFGQRGGIISPLLFWFLIYTHRKKNINLNFLPLFALGIIVGLVALQTIRDANFSGIADIDVISSIISGYGGFGERLITYAEVYANVPGLLDFQYGKTYLTLFTQFIPRDIWPDKWDTAGYLITKNVTADWATSQRANTQGTLFGEAFLNFSHLGLIIVPIVYGSCVNFIEQHYLKNHDVWCLVKYAILALSFLFMITGDFVNTMFGALISWFVISILEFFQNKGSMSIKPSEAVHGCLL